jgi:hypothetical protein
MGSKKKASKTTKSKKLAKKKVVKKTKPKVEKLPTPEPMVKSEEPKSAANMYDDEISGL